VEETNSDHWSDDSFDIQLSDNGEILSAENFDRLGRRYNTRFQMVPDNHADHFAERVVDAWHIGQCLHRRFGGDDVAEWRGIFVEDVIFNSRNLVFVAVARRNVGIGARIIIWMIEQGCRETAREEGLDTDNFCTIIADYSRRSSIRFEVRFPTYPDAAAEHLHLYDRPDLGTNRSGIVAGGLRRCLSSLAPEE
jgi:hypothetical protein